MKLRYWYKTDHNKKPIPGSNVRRKSRPGASHQWREILDPCCSPLDVTCTCGPRYFVQLDGRGKPVDGTLIKRIHGNRPEGTDGAKFYELDWKSVCCDTITWSFTITDGTGSFVITVNGNEVVNDIIGNINSTGTVPANLGDTIVVTMTNTSLETQVNSLQVTGGHTFSDTDIPVATYTFIWNGINTTLAGVIDETE